MPNVTLSCERFCPTTNQIGKNGKKKRIVIFVRKMRLSGQFLTGTAFEAATTFEVNYLKRGGEFRFYIKSLIPPVKEKWQTLCLSPIKIRIKWKSEGNYTYTDFVSWLKRMGVVNAESLTVELMTMPPENLAA